MIQEQSESCRSDKTATLHLHLLGDFLLVSGDAPVTTFTVPRLQSLLAYLVLQRTAPQDRARLAFLLWPDSNEGQAYSNLRKLLSQLRQTLPQADHFLRADRRSLQWRPTYPDSSWTLDVLDLEQALTQATQAEQARDLKTARQALEQTVQLYRGDLLPSCYDEWILPERDRLRQLFSQAAERLIVLLEQERDYDDAISTARRLLRHDPLHEATYHQLMRLYALRGDRAAALRVYHSCATTLERELGTEPSEAIRQAYQALLQMDGFSSAKATAPMPRGTTATLVGRKPEWGQLQMAWRRTASGHSHLVVLSGEAGIGKTRLAEEMVAWVSRQGMATAHARCYAAEGRLAYTPVTAWLNADAVQMSLPAMDDIWLTGVARLVPVLLAKRPGLPRPDPMTEGWQRQRFFEALARALLGARQPLLLLLDDLQWCDQETLEWLHYLLRFELRAQVLLLATVRSEETQPEHPLMSFLGTLQREGLLTEIALGPLNTTETTALAERIAGHQLDPALANDLYQETEGNPLFVVEMMRAGTLEQHVANMPHSLLTHPTSQLPPTVQTVLTARLAQLSPLARELASLAAVIGQEFSFAVLARASSISEEALVQGLDELWQRRVVREQSVGTFEAYDFSHDKLRELAYVSLSPTHRRLLHRRVAEALEEANKGDLDAVSSQVAAHYERAGLPARAIPYYQQAGEVASRVYAHAEAIAAFQRATALLEVTSPERPKPERRGEVPASLYEHLGDVLEVTGKHAEARQAYRQAMAQVPAQGPVWLARLHRKAAKTWNFPPDPEAALRMYQEAERILEQATESSSTAWRQEWLQIQLDQLHPYYMLAQAQEMKRVIGKAQSIIEQDGTAAQRAIFFLYAALPDTLQDHHAVSEETVSYCRRALEASLESGLPSVIGQARFGLGYCLWLFGDFDEAEEQMHAAMRVGEQIGDVELAGRSLVFLAILFRRRGRVEDVRNALSRALALQETRYAGVITANRAWVAWRDGNLEEAEAYGRAAMEAWQHQQHVYAFQWTGLWPLIGVALTQERLSDVMRYVCLLLDSTQQRPPETLLAVLKATAHAWEAGQHETVRALLQRALPLAQEMGYL